MRTTFSDFRQSRIPQAIGLCAADIPRMLSYCNEATERLIRAGGDTGWWGGWYRTAFTVADDGTITLPREVARVANVSVCDVPIRIHNEWYEFLEAGVGPQQDLTGCTSQCGYLQMFDRGTVATQVDIATSNKKLRVFATDSRDYGKRILIKGLDNNQRVIHSTSGSMDVDGMFLTLASPFTDSDSIYTKITGVSKDYTYGDVLLYEVDIDTGAQVLLAIYGPTEINPSYRRYYINNLPATCCGGSEDVVVVGMAKIEFIPVTQDTDFLPIGNIPALKQECMAIWNEEKDSLKTRELAMVQHSSAIRLLQQELVHYLGRQRPAVNMPVFGSAKLENHGIGTLV